MKETGLYGAGTRARMHMEQKALAAQRLRSADPDRVRYLSRNLARDIFNDWEAVKQDRLLRKQPDKDKSDER